MTQVEVELLIGGCTILMSVIGSALALGLALGTFRGAMLGKFEVMQSSLNFMSDRLAKIEGMFTLTPVDRTHYGTVLPYPPNPPQSSNSPVPPGSGSA